MDDARVVNRNFLPRWVNALIDAIADSPMSPIGRLAARRWGRAAPTGSVAVTTFDDRPLRVLIAPVNYSGQGLAWAHALSQSGRGISARNMAVDVPGGFSFEADLVVPVATYHNDSNWQRRQLEAAATATHVLIEAEEPPFGRLLGRSVRAQAEALAKRGVDVAFLAHGTDVRLPSRHIAHNPWSYYSDPSIYVPRAESLAARNIEMLRESGRPLFVSTPDLLADLPTATWCPVAIDVSRWESPRRPRGRGRPLRVLHAPSVGPVKGTSLIMPTLEALESKGVIDLELVRGVPSARMPAVFAGADVVIDQFRIGAYGVAACEAMAAGCIVVGSVSEDVRRTARTHAGAELPLIEATPLDLDAVLRALASESDLEPLRADGLSFVRALHDGRASARALIDGWIQPASPDDRKVESHAPAG